MPVPRSFKTDQSFLEKIAIGATGTKRAFQDLRRQGHEPLELERGSMSFKIWKKIKIKRIRVPDILCVRCGRRFESRAKSKLEITMSHSVSDPERGWDASLNDEDFVALVLCHRAGPGPLDWSSDSLVQYISVHALRQAAASGQVVQERPKGAGEGFEIRLTWPAAVVAVSAEVDSVDHTAIRLRAAGKKRLVSLRRKKGQLLPLVQAGEMVEPSQVVAAVVPVTVSCPCPGGADVDTYVALAGSTDRSNRFAAVKALGQFSDAEATRILRNRLNDSHEHLYVRIEAASALMRRGATEGEAFLAMTLHDEYLANRLEAVIVLAEVANPRASELLTSVLNDPGQDPEIRAGSAWSLGEIGAREALPSLVRCFTELALEVRLEAARALAKIARGHLTDVVRILPDGSPDQRPGIAWAISKAGGFRVEDLLPGLRDQDGRHWIAFIIGTQPQDAMLPEISVLADRDPEVYFAVTVLWKIFSSWVYGLEEY